MEQATSLLCDITYRAELIHAPANMDSGAYMD